MNDVTSFRARAVLIALVLALIVALGAGCASLLGADFDRPGAPDDAGLGAQDGAQGDAPTTAADGAPLDTGGACTRDDVADCVGKCGELKGRCGPIITCGGCPSGQSCGGAGANACGTGSCTPTCAGKACGANDGCSSVCQSGDCGSGLRCVSGSCACDTTSCPGCCSGNACRSGGDGNACGKGGVVCAVCSPGTTCGTGDCGTCGGHGQICCAGNACAAPGSCGGGGTAGVCGCTPSCTGKACGASDGCGGTCTSGSCAAGLHCTGTVCACDGTSCSGCCSGGACVGGASIAACGTGGVGCATCTAPTGNGAATCTTGTCGVTCDSGYTACGSSQCCKNKVAFVSSTLSAGNLGGLAGADSTCRTLAAGAGLGGTFKAWLSDTGLTAASRLTHSLAPYVLVNGTTKVANDWAGLTSGTLLHEIDTTEGGARPNIPIVWTGTTVAGAYSGSGCGDWKSGANAVGGSYGQATYTDVHWTQFPGLSGACDFNGAIYCLEQ